jgi:hypothetical protein
LCVGEEKEVAAQGIARQTVAHQTTQTIEPLAHVRCARRQVDPRSRSESEHGLHSLQYAYQLLQCANIETTPYFDPPPACQHNRQAAAPVVRHLRGSARAIERLLRWLGAAQRNGNRRPALRLPSLTWPMPLAVAIPCAHRNTVKAAELSSIQTARLTLGDQLLCFLTAPTTMPPTNDQVLFAHATSSSHSRKQNQMRLL